MRIKLVLACIIVLCLLLYFVTLTRRSGVEPRLAVSPTNGLLIKYNAATTQSAAETVHIVQTMDGFTVTEIPESRPARPGWYSLAKPVIPFFPKSFADSTRVKSGNAEVSAKPVGGHDSAGVIAGDGCLVYNEAFAGCDVKYKCSENKTEEFIVVKTNSRKQPGHGIWISHQAWHRV